jgi:hypothetical protein
MITPHRIIIVFVVLDHHRRTKISKMKLKLPSSSWDHHDEIMVLHDGFEGEDIQ